MAAAVPPDQNGLTMPRETEGVKSSPKVYSAGTLRYTLFGLINLFVWLLWGDFCLVMLESIVPRLFPLILKDSGASNTLIGIMVGSVAGLINLTVTPVVSVRSDRYRSQWGRRIPYLIWTSPLAAGLLILIGYADLIGGAMNAAVLSRFLNVSDVTTVLIVVCVLMASFHLFNTLMVMMYNCLLADVVPPAVIGKFMAAMRTVSLAAKVLFSRYVFGLSESHCGEVFLTVGLIYLISFLLMCWRVKEGQYPPVTAPPASGRALGAVKIYLRECFTIPFYLCLFLGGMIMACTGCFSPFYIFFYRETLGLSLDDIGKLIGWGYLFQALVCLPIGWATDRLRPIPMSLFGLVYIAVSHVWAYFFAQDWNSLFIVSLVSLPGPICFGIGLSTMTITLLPKAKYAQFTSAAGIVTAVGLIVGNFLCGVFFDHFKAYRLVYPGTAALAALAIVPLLFVYYGWKKHGGPDHYTPPETTL